MHNSIEKQEAIAAVEASSADWRPFAIAALWVAATRMEELTSDDVWDVLDSRGIPRPTEPRAMGPVMISASGSVIEPTGNFRLSASTVNHNRPQRLYRSLVVGKNPPPWPTISPLRQGPVPVPSSGNAPDGRIVFGSTIVCPSCEGRKQIRSAVCWRCAGSGITSARRG